MIDNPITRKEKYLAKLTGSYTGNVPDPITRVEKYLYDLCQKGISGLTPEEIENAVNKYLKENPVQPGATEEQAQQIKQNTDDVGSLKEELSNTESVVKTPLNIYGLDSFVFTIGKYINYSGELVDYAGARHTELIFVPKGTKINAKLSVIVGVSVGIAFFDANSGTIDLDKSIYSTTGINGQVTQITREINIDRDGYIEIAKQIDFSETDTIQITVPTKINEEVANQWKGKQWYCFGTSITDNVFPNPVDNNNPTGKYSNELTRLSGLIQNNHGVAGGRIATSTIYDPTAHMYLEITNTDVSSADLITIEGFVNDVTASTPIGELGVKDLGTLIGSLSSAVEHCLNNSNALVVLITSSMGKPYVMPDNTKPNYGTTYKNSIGLGIVDYNNAVKKVAEYYCIPCIDAGGMSMINEFHPEYIVDQIHHSNLGGKQYAQVIWSELKNMNPIKKLI